jgi:hypothetical protein
MSDRIKRDTSGHFALGQSGNPEGARRRKPRELITITDLQRIHLEVAGEIIGTKDGKPVTRYENAVRTLAKGDAANRLATKDFLDMSRQSGHHFAGLARDQARKERG